MIYCDQCSSSNGHCMQKNIAPKEKKTCAEKNQYQNTKSVS